MLFKYHMCLDWTLALCVKLPDGKFRHVDDCDATLTISYWDEGDDVVGWELDAAEIDGVEITDKSDREFWQIIKRAVDHDDRAINDFVQGYAPATEVA